MTSRINYNNPKQTGELGLSYHYELISDEKRINPFKQAISLSSKDKIILESGTGSGIMSLLAAKAGARKIYAVEFDPSVASFAKRNFEATGYKNIKLIVKNTLDVCLEDIDSQRPDVLIAEHLSTWQVMEPQIKVLNHIIEKLAHKHTIFLPNCIFNYMELAESKYFFEDLVQFRTHYIEFSGIKRPKILSDRILFQEIQLSRTNPLFIDNIINIEVKEDGVLNSLRLTSPLEVYKHITFESSDSLMPPVIVPMKNTLEVKKGELVHIHIQYEMHTSWKEFYCRCYKDIWE